MPPPRLNWSKLQVLCKQTPDRFNIQIRRCVLIGTKGAKSYFRLAPGEKGSARYFYERIDPITGEVSGAYTSTTQIPEEVFDQARARAKIKLPDEAQNPEPKPPNYHMVVTPSERGRSECSKR